jgi:hypothetical protein
MTILAALCAITGGCGGWGPSLDPTVVSNLPPGNATGSAASGSYRIELATTSCSGQCPSISYFGFKLTLCEIGRKFDEDAKVTQSDGRLEITISGSSFYVRTLKGGISSDGSYDVGGTATQAGGAVAVSARAQGTMNGATVGGEARAHGVGQVEGVAVDCYATFSVSGQRK